MEDSERLRKLCEQASVERDSKKLIELINQINALCDKRELEKRQSQQRQEHAPVTGPVNPAGRFDPSDPPR